MATTATKEAKVPVMQIKWETRVRWREWVKAGKEPTLEHAKELIISELGPELGLDVADLCDLEPDGRLDQTASCLSIIVQPRGYSQT